MFGFDEKYTGNCRIYNMLKNAAEHISFHTPGHKKGKWDITELSFSDNLSSPTGVLKAAQEDIAKILGAERSFILTDGSTCGVLSMLRAAEVKKLLFPVCSHKSVYNGCKLMGIVPVTIENRYVGSVPQIPAAEEIEKAVMEKGCDGVLLTSPDYYGNIADYESIKEVCLRHGIPLLCDGAHGAHLRGTDLYAGRYCDIWVDGVHKNLPAFTQGAVVSAKARYAEKLADAVDIFRTTSPNYLIMASVEYAVKYPANRETEFFSEKLKNEFHAYKNADWSKIVITYGENADRVNDYLESKGIYAEFCDGENILFYLSPATKAEELETLENYLRSLRPMQRKGSGMPEVKSGTRTENVAWMPLSESVGRTCAQSAGLFPPCIPLIREGEVIPKTAVEKLQAGKNTYGLKKNKVAVYDDERKTN